MKPESYPFQPKSTRNLTPGHFWAIPLEDGGYACGLVVETDGGELVMAALLDWTGDEPPTEAEISAVTTILKHGAMGIRGITRAGDLVRGRRDLDRFPIELPETVSHRGGGTVWVLRGEQQVRRATSEEAASMPVHHTLGYSSLRVAANRRLVHDPDTD